eukprot:TRINITY_DN12238_c0_g1_i1.p1 TRINITY_DN12238_c0_g1~~TRINITY_DN12238_c0_g1_i1.p1  ORF type:complete len:114 (+),score=24.58 TRINITY_DN12238_c0_g1_i1:117-458(+)
MNTMKLLLLVILGMLVICEAEGKVVGLKQAAATRLIHYRKRNCHEACENSTHKEQCIAFCKRRIETALARRLALQNEEALLEQPAPEKEEKHEERTLPHGHRRKHNKIHYGSN